MTRYTVDSDAVDSAAAAITATVSRLQGEVTSLHGQLDALQGVWTGAAAVAFQGVLCERACHLLGNFAPLLQLGFAGVPIVGNSA